MTANNKLLLGFLAILMLGCEPGAKHKKISKPNIIMILTDDQGWGDLSLNGNSNLSTPNIDHLAQTGVSFERFYVSPVCSPTRAEMLTGRYSVRGGVYSTSAGGERLDLDETTIAEVFKSAGYATAAYGKWHNGMQHPYHPNSRGFDDFYGFCSGHWGSYFDPLLEHNGRLVKGKGFLVDDLTSHGLSFIEQHQQEPFFLYLPLNTPHSPMQVPDEYWQKFENKELTQKGTLPDRENIQHTRAALAMCENIDWNVGRIMEKLEEFKLTENTLLIYFSDNGPNGHRWNGGMKGTKGSTDEGGVRSPMIMNWKGTFAAGKKIPQIAAAIDLLPTLADLAGIEVKVNKPLDGVSLKPLLMEENPNWQDRLIFNYWRDRLSVRSQQYRLDHQDQLYDMISDPNQTQNIAEQQAKVHSQLLTAKSQWQADVLSELPEKDERPFVMGHPDFPLTQIPARDGIAHGNIQRSNRWPNCSYFTNWTSIDDKITWEAELFADGEFEIVLYYTCPEDALGSTIQFSFRGESIHKQITEAHDPPATGMEHDRVERGESYVKDFKPLSMGTVKLTKGKGMLELKATEIPGSQAMEFRLMMLRRVE